MLKKMLLAVCLVASANPGFGGERENTTVEDLTANDKQLRDAATQQLEAQRKKQVAMLTEQLGSKATLSDKSFDGRMHTLLKGVTILRGVELAPKLVEVLDFQLDFQTSPPYMKLPAAAYFPVAECLGKLGGPEVTESLMQALMTSDSETRRQLAVWCLRQIHGAGVEGLLAERVTQVKTDEDKKGRLQKALEISKSQKDFPIPIKR